MGAAGILPALTSLLLAPLGAQASRLPRPACLMRGPEDQEGRQDACGPGKSAASQLAVPRAHNPHSVPNDPSVSAIRDDASCGLPAR